MKTRRLINLNDSSLAKMFDRLGLYLLYRFFLVRLGYQNPFVCVIKVTSRCNLRCAHCPWPEGKKDLSTAEINRKIEEAAAWGCVAVIFEGGEPTLRPDLPELIAYARQCGLICILITNGLNDVSAYPVDSIWISIEGDEATHNAIRGPNAFRKTVRNYRALQGRNVIVLMTISRLNRHDVEKLPALFPEARVWYNFLYPYKNIQVPALEPDEIRATAQEILRLKRQHPHILNSNAYLKNAGKKVCCYDWWTFTVDAEGHSNIGCTVEQSEPADCDRCFLACYAESYHVLQGRLDSFRYIRDISGMTKGFPFFYRKPRL